jgi:hypothetical protein
MDETCSPTPLGLALACIGMLGLTEIGRARGLGRATHHWTLTPLHHVHPKDYRYRAIREPAVWRLHVNFDADGLRAAGRSRRRCRLTAALPSWGIPSRKACRCASRILRGPPFDAHDLRGQELRGRQLQPDFLCHPMAECRTPHPALAGRPAVVSDDVASDERMLAQAVRDGSDARRSSGSG